MNYELIVQGLFYLISIQMSVQYCTKTADTYVYSMS
jgi:hypothetical protein